MVAHSWEQVSIEATVWVGTPSCLPPTEHDITCWWREGAIRLHRDVRKHPTFPTTDVKKKGPRVHFYD